MPVYLDHAATTPVLPEALEAYTRAMAQVGNPSSIHSAGQNAKRMLEDARERIAVTLGCQGIELVFTSGGTEAINLGIKGLYWERARAGARRILVPEGEHHATIDTVEWLASYEKADVEWIPLDDQGFVRLDALEAALRREPEEIALLTFLWANNEVGTVQPAERLIALAASAGVPVHVDAVSAYGHLPIDFGGMRARTGSKGQAGLTALSVSAHKIGGPVGAGALVLSRDATVVPLIHGGGQQRQVRSGTQDVAAAAAFAVAASHAESERAADAERLAALRDRLIAGVRAAVPSAVLSGPEPVPAERRTAGEADARLASNAHFTFPGCEGDSLLFLLDAAGVEVSTGSACQAGIPEPSHVLRAMGRGEDEARGALRITMGRTSTDDDVDAFLAALPDAYAQASRAGLAARESALGAR
ncbi:cysteine desulfurase family protein [Humibacter ginsenosidimutans]|uniref:Cysteine desulfurase n=1 Tax=Humibacter ginsenosidimutans TaxID=2599293 RepID=A0A5B8M2Q4_9MICO|nr:cysteine desulfurase family protein [Humibacter ginsenosidimutans]QDZ14065.1 cysteine desulfurase [Humibacter ginsenosidimutans]